MGNIIMELEEFEPITLPMPKHRVFTYHEKKFNQMNRKELLTYIFNPKLDREAVKYWYYNKYEQTLGDRKLKSLIYAVQVERSKKLTEKHDQMIENIFVIKDSFTNITLIEAMAINKRQLEKWRSEPRKTPIDDIDWHDVLIEAVNYHINNWNKSIKNLKENRKQEK